MHANVAGLKTKHLFHDTFWNSWFLSKLGQRAPKLRTKTFSEFISQTIESCCFSSKMLLGIWQLLAGTDELFLLCYCSSPLSVSIETSFLRFGIPCSSSALPCWFVSGLGGSKASRLLEHLAPHATWFWGQVACQVLGTNSSKSLEALGFLAHGHYAWLGSQTVVAGNQTHFETFLAGWEPLEG